MNRIDNRDDLLTLFARVRDGLASDEQFEQLQLLLEADGCVRQLWLEFSGIELGLTEFLSSEASPKLVNYERVFAAQAVPTPSRINAPGRAELSLQRVRELINRYPVISCLIATVVVTTAVLAMSLLRAPGVPSIANSSSQPIFVGQITGLQGAKWSDRQIGTTEGAFLPLNHLMELHSGFAEVTLRSGAKFVMEGPAQLRITERNVVYLSSGKLAAIVPPRAHGFTVVTPHGPIEDLGTEFAVEVDIDEGLQAHCFGGEIVFRPSQEKALRLVAGQGVRHRLGDIYVHREAADEAKFTRELRLRSKLSIDNRGLVNDRRFGTNVAAKAIATQSSTYNDNPGYAAAIAIDGNPDTFTHTSGKEKDAWLLLDLGGSHLIDVIVVHNRTQCCGERLRDIYVEILGDDGKTIVFQSPKLNDGNSRNGPARLMVGLPELAGNKVAGRYVRVRRMGQDPEGHDQRTLSLGEVQVFAEPMITKVEIPQTPPGAKPPAT